ncbi:sensor histidine kinase [Adhaeribacter pallidiroseus]|uniref:Histidine kinase n=1 Tax=Adhaeribacter pallidiroseus TaxID=2072847 RepID=A0A369QBG6_9BACT|nr:histidine kinase [Adhaeribacter pallidiroseus]RDC62054.1 Histidine kinase [Adhaeribacter pallidiroseus]
MAYLHKNISVPEPPVKLASSRPRHFAKFLKWVILIFLLVQSLAIIPYIQHPEKWQVKSGIFNLFFSAVAFALLWTANHFLSRGLERYYPWLQHPIRRLWISAVATLVVSFTIIMGINLVLLPLRGLSFNALGTNQWISMVFGPVIITFFISLFMHSRSFLLGWRQTAIDAERLQKENIASQYESLKTQVNPHFLFNSLNALTSLVTTDPDLAVKFIKQLSEVYRYVLDSQNKEVVPLADELNFVQSYIFLQQIRYGESLQITTDLAELYQYQIAPLSVQMLLENAIKHNMILEDQPLHLKIAVTPDEYLAVENNFQIKNFHPDSIGMGLKNIEARYRYLTARPVLIEQTSAYFRVKLPLLYFTS